MKPIVIDITKSVLDVYTTSSSSVSGISVKGTEVRSCTVPNHLVAFPQIAVKILELFSIGKTDCEFRKIRTDDGAFGLVTIKGNSDNNAIFEIFRKFGILTGNLTIGVSGTPSNPVIYTNSKMMKDISKYAPEVQAALSFTLYSIAKVCAQVIGKTPKITTTCTSSNTSCDMEFNDFIMGFASVSQITLKEIPTDNYVEIEYYNNVYSTVSSTYSDAVRYNVLAKTEPDGSFIFAESAIISAVAFTTVVYPILILRNGTVLTTMELTNFESAKDSYITALVSHYRTPTVKVKNVPLEELVKQVPENASMIDILDDTDLEATFMYESVKNLSDWNASAKGTLHEGLDEKVSDAVTRMLGIKTSTVSTVLDCTAMKELYKEDKYAQQLYAQVQPYYDTFELGNLNANLKGFAKGDLYSMLFAGDSGTGKSTAARVIPARCGIPYISINFSVNIEESDIFGSMIPNTMKASADDPEFVWQDGVLTKAVRNGYCAVLEEINFARPGVLGKLNSLLDENRQIDLPTGEVLKAHPNFRIIATCNVAYEGTNRFNKALINRFDDCTVFRDVTRAKAIEIIKERTGYKNMTKIDTVYNVYEALKKYGKEQNLNLIVSMRQLLNLFSKGKYYTDAKDAVIRIMINGAFIEEPEYQEEFEKTILPAFKLSFKL